MGNGKKGISSFSVLLLMAVTAVVGVACFSMLKVQYTPSVATNTLTVDYRYPGASARIVEAEVTSKIEGVLCNIRHCSDISSTSSDGSGRVSLSVSKHANLEAVRFEAASLIRNLYASLPDGCSYPSLSVNARGQKPQTAIAYSIRSRLPSQKIAIFVENNLLPPLSKIEGVNNVEFHGQTPFEWAVTFDADKALYAGITAADIRAAFSSYYADSFVGVAQDDGQSFVVNLRNDSSAGMESIPIKNADGRIVHLADLATIRYQESLPNSYYRINGLNVLNLSVEVSSKL